GGNGRPGDRGRGPRQRPPRGVAARRGVPRPGVLRLRGEVPRRHVPYGDPRGAPPGGGPGVAGACGGGVPGRGRLRDGPGRLLLRRGWPRPGGQRDQHHPGIHGHLDVPQALGGLRAALPAPARPAGRTCAGAPPAATTARGRGCAVAGGSGCHRWTLGQVRVRVMPSTAWIVATTSLPRSSTVLASALTMTS